MYHVFIDIISIKIRDYFYYMFNNFKNLSMGPNGNIKQIGGGHRQQRAPDASIVYMYMSRIWALCSS